MKIKTLLCKIGTATQVAVGSLPIVAPNFGADLDCTVRGTLVILIGILADAKGGGSGH